MKSFWILGLWMLVAGSAGANGVEQGVAEALAIIQQKSLKVDDEAVRKAVVVAIARVADPGAEVFSGDGARHRQEEFAGRDYAAGFRLGITNGLPLVLDVTADGPAAKAGVLKGDIITGISKAGTFDVIALPEALRATRGRAGDKLELQLRRGTIVSNTTAIELASLPLPSIECSETLPNSILYLKVNGLFTDGGESIAAELRAWTAKKRSGVILDLRGASGSELADAAVVASLFAKEGDVLFSLRDLAGHDLSVVKATGGKPLNIPVMVLLDEQTSGAAEVLAAALKDSVKGAMLVGQVTHADPMVREFIKLESGDALYLATKVVVTADGSRYDGRSGVKPDVVAGVSAGVSEYDAEPVADHRRALLDQELQDFALRNRIRGDATLRRAVDILLGLKALNIGSGLPTPGGG